MCAGTATSTATRGRRLSSSLSWSSSISLCLHVSFCQQSRQQGPWGRVCRLATAAAVAGCSPWQGASAQRAGRTRPADVIGSVTLVVVKGDERAEEYRQQMQNLQKYAAVNSLPPVRDTRCPWVLCCTHTLHAASGCAQDLKDNMLSHLKMSFDNKQLRRARGMLLRCSAAGCCRAPGSLSTPTCALQR